MGLRGRALFVLSASSALGGLAALGTACITPPPEWLNPPPTRPIILDALVRPPLDQFLQNPPPTFSIPISLADSQDSFHFSAFLDYDPSVDTPPFQFGLVTPPTTQYTLTIFTPTIPADNRCHRLDVIVAHNFATLLDGQVLYHTLDSVDGDQVGWFIAPSGNPTSCFGFDAGPTAVDASPEGAALEGGTSPEGAAAP